MYNKHKRLHNENVLSKGESPKTVHSVRERTVRGPEGRE